MAHDVFISYSSKDKPIADGVCANLEAIGIRCWIAPRDIAAGEDWPTAIAKAISKSRVMVLVFSASSNSSEDVGRELILASNSKLVIIPFKIENIEPEPGKQYYLARTHWLDAMNPPTKGQIAALVNRVKAILPATEPVDINQTEPDRKLQPSPMDIPSRKRQNMLFLGGLIALGLIAGFVFGTRYIEQIKATAPALPSPVLSQPNTQVISVTPAEGSQPVPSPTDTPEISTMPVSGSQAEQARTFAQPILNIVAKHKPDFEDDFSKVNPDWFFNNIQGTSAIEDGVARFHSTGDVIMSNDRALTGKDFVLQFDARLVSGDTTSQITMGLHGVSDRNKFFMFIHPAVTAWEIGGIWGSNFSPIAGIRYIRNGQTRLAKLCR